MDHVVSYRRMYRKYTSLSKNDLSPLLSDLSDQVGSFSGPIYLIFLLSL